MNKKRETKIVQCEKTNKSVSIVLEYVIKSTDQRSYVGQQLSRFDCLNKMNCPFVAVEKGNSIMFNWENCPYSPKTNTNK